MGSSCNDLEKAFPTLFFWVLLTPAFTRGAVTQAGLPSWSHHLAPQTKPQNRSIVLKLLT